MLLLPPSPPYTIAQQQSAHQLSRSLQTRAALHPPHPTPPHPHPAPPPQLVRCQVALEHALLPHTCLRLLGLPGTVVPEPERVQVLQQLLSLSRASPAGLALSGGSGACQLSAMQALVATPAPRRYSAFYGAYRPDGRPRLQPTPVAGQDEGDGYGGGGGGEEEAALDHRRQLGQGQGLGFGGGSGRRRPGAPLVRAGDVAQVHMLVVSNLPGPIRILDVRLVLGALQPGGRTGPGGAPADRDGLRRPDASNRPTARPTAAGGDPTAGAERDDEGQGDAAAALRASRSASNLQALQGAGVGVHAADRPPRASHPTSHPGSAGPGTAPPPLSAAAAAARRLPHLRAHSRSHSYDQRLEPGEGDRTGAGGSSVSAPSASLPAPGSVPVLSTTTPAVGAGTAADGGLSRPGAAAAGGTGGGPSGSTALGPLQQGEAGQGAPGASPAAPAWREAEDLTCCNLVSVAWPSSGTAGAGVADSEPTGGSGRVLVKTPEGSSSEASASPEQRAVDECEQEWEVGGYAPDGTLEIRPGVNRCEVMEAAGSVQAYGPSRSK